MTTGRLESSKNKRATSAKEVKKWLISATETTATITNSSDKQTTKRTSQVREANNATTSTKGDISESGHATKSTAILTLLFAEIEVSNKRYRKINKNAGKLTMEPNPTPNTPKTRKITIDTNLYQSSHLNSSRPQSRRSKQMPKSRKDWLASDPWRQLNLV